MGNEPAGVSVTGTESVEALIGHETVAEPTAPPAWDRGAAAAAKQGRLQSGDRVALLGIGSGINVIMLGVQWRQGLVAQAG